MYSSSFVSRSHRNLRANDPRKESLRLKRQSIRNIAKMYQPSGWVQGGVVVCLVLGAAASAWLDQYFHWGAVGPMLGAVCGLFAAHASLALFMALDRHLTRSQR